MNISTTATLRIEERGHCKEVARVVERLKQESMYGLFCPQGRKKNGRCREVAVSGGSTVFKNTAENHDIIHIPVEFYNLYWLISAISVKGI